MLKNPRHELCPTDEDTWCWWQAREMAEDPEIEEELSHDEPLDKEVAKKILPIYEDLSRDDLLQRCLGGHTQNSNESLNALIWKFAPKHFHSGKETVEIASYLAASMYNESYTAIVWIMVDLGITIGMRTYEFSNHVNKRCEKKKHF